MVRRLLVSVFLAAFPVMVIPIAVTSIGARAGAAPPAAVQQCKDGGWQTLTNASGQPFKNQGQCITFAIHHPVSLVDLTSSSPFTGTTSVVLDGNGCDPLYQTFDVVYPGSSAVGNVTLDMAGCFVTTNEVHPPFTFAGSFTITTSVGTLNGSASGPIDVQGNLVIYQITLSVKAGTGSFTGTTGSLLFSTTINGTAPPTSFVGSITVS
jgi:hypothetical protein